ncbi:MAG: SBBP repeat-containing protein [Campylobacterota bacterium]|nr:SBBP repeat-containing protein [Campylobacterota bacterium]
MLNFTNKKNKLLISAVAAASIFGFSGCLDERPLPTDELISIYNSDLEKTNRLKPLDTMYVKVAGLKANEKHEIRILDSNKNLITMTQAYADDSGVIQVTPVWYDVGLKKPTEETPEFTVDSGLGIKSFYINVVDRYANGEDTDFEQAFFYVLKDEDEKQEVTITNITYPTTASIDKNTTQTTTVDDANITAQVDTTVDLSNYQRAKVYASTSTGEMENAFEEQNSKYMNGDTSILTKVYLTVDQLPKKIFNTGTTSDTDVENIDIYVIPYGKNKLSDIDLSDDSIVKVTKTRTELLAGPTLVWDINLTNPDNENNAYSIILDINQDGKYSKGLDLDDDDLSDIFIDGADGVYTAGFIVKNTPANDPLPFELTDAQGDGVSSIPAQVSDIDNRLYLSVENIASPKSSVEVEIKDENNTTVSTETIDLKTPSTDDAVRFLKYIESEKIFDISDYNGTGTLSINIVDINFSTTFEVYPVNTETTTHSSATDDTKVTTFDETGTTDGDTSIFMKFGKAGATNASVYLFDGNVSWDENRSLEGSVIKNTDINITNQTTITKVFDLDSNGTQIINPSSNNGIFDIVVDYDNNGLYDNNDTKLNITIRDTIANNLPNVGYINIASNGYYSFDNHYTDSNQTSDYGYIDEFAVDGSNTYGRSIRAIWNPYLKNKKSGGFYANYYTTGDGDESVYVDENQEVQESPFNFNQQLDLYIIDAETYPLKKGMSLDDDMDLRGEKQTITTQYSCSNGALIQSIVSKRDMKVGKYNVILDVNRNGKLDDGIDYVDAVTQKGKKISEEDPNVTGFQIVTELTNTSTSWVREFGTRSSDYTQDIAADSSGNTYTLGYTYGTFEDETRQGSYDGFIAKYNKDGNKTWTTQFGTSSYDYATGIASSSSGNTYAVGYTYGEINSTKIGGYDGFIAKYDADGNQTWARQFGTSSSDYIQKVALDQNENAYVSGYTYGTIDNNTRVGSYDAFVVKYDKDGNKTWSKQFGTTSYDYTTNITTDEDNNIYVTGYTYGTLSEQTRAGGYDVFVVKYNSAGVKQWAKQFGSTSYDYPYGIAANSNGDVYISGYTSGSIDNENRLGGYDGFIVKYSSDGTKQSTKQFGTSTYDYFKEIVVDSSDNIYVSGYTYGKMDAHNSFGGYDGVVVKFDTDLNQIWAKQFGTTSSDYMDSVATDGTDVYVSGYTYGEFSGQERVGSYDAFVGKINLSVEE